MRCLIITGGTIQTEFAIKYMKELGIMLFVQMQG